jgi:hypothetical protein
MHGIKQVLSEKGKPAEEKSKNIIQINHLATLDLLNRFNFLIYINELLIYKFFHRIMFKKIF